VPRPARITELEVKNNPNLSVSPFTGTQSLSSQFSGNLDDPTPRAAGQRGAPRSRAAEASAPAASASLDPESWRAVRASALSRAEEFAKRHLIRQAQPPKSEAAMENGPDHAAPAAPYDDSGWPIVMVFPPPPGSSSERFRAHLNQIDALFARRQPFALLVDVRQSAPLSALERRMVAERMAQNHRAGPGLLKAMAMVLRTRAQRGIFTAVHWLQRPAYPTRAFDALPAARAWLRERVADP
jgi:hypothetical protein